MSEISLLSSNEFHHEFGYFWPSARIRGHMRLAIVAVVSASTLAAAGQFSRMASQDLDTEKETYLALEEVIPLSDRPAAVVANTYSAVILPHYKRKHRATESHALALVPIGRDVGRAAETTPIETADPPPIGPAAKGVAESREFRTVTVHDGRRQQLPQVFVVPVE